MIGAINGAAITGGFELALACDMLIASTEARFADTHARVGIVPGWGLSQKLSRLVGLAEPKEISLTGNFVGAQEAERIGTVNRVVAPETLLPAARRLAEDLLSAVPEMLPEMKQLIDEGYALPLGEALALERRRSSAWSQNHAARDRAAARPCSSAAARAERRRLSPAVGPAAQGTGRQAMAGAGNRRRNQCSRQRNNHEEEGMAKRKMAAVGRWLAAAGLAGLACTAQAQKAYDTGASDSEIKINNTVPYSGPASAYGTVGKAAAAYFRKVNAEGGINGRKIRFISVDDAYSPPMTVEQTRKLVEQEQVLLIFAPLGTASNAATQKYLNMKKVPQLFVSSGATAGAIRSISRGPWAGTSAT